jgi:hypothetical protein
VGEGLRSVGMSPIGPNQERVLYPARRSPFKGRGILRGIPDFIMLVSLAALLPPLARPSHCALGALRWIVSGETMTTVGGPGTTLRRIGPSRNSLVLGPPASIMGSDLARNRAPTLRFAPPQCRSRFLMYRLAGSGRT